jgi:hypothetical protein
MNAATHEYRAKAFECVSLAEWMNNPGERAETLRFARTWIELAEPIEEAVWAYEVPRGADDAEPRLARALRICVGNELRQLYGAVINEPLPPKITDQLQRLDR